MVVDIIKIIMYNNSVIIKRVTRERVRVKEMIRLQVTLFDTNNKYKPISTTVEVESVSYYKEHTQEVRHKAIEKICAKRYTTPKLLAKDGYNQIKVRVYQEQGKISKADKVQELEKLMQARVKRKELNK